MNFERSEKEGKFLFLRRLLAHRNTLRAKASQSVSCANKSRSCHKMETKEWQYGTTRALGNKSGGFCEAVNCERSEQEGKFLFAYLMAPF